MRAIKRPVVAGDDRLVDVKDILRRVVLASVRVKAHVVSADEREGGLRNLLNFGHTIGHAFEGLLTPQILHGECVAIGMVLEAQLARFLGILNGAAVSRLARCLKSFELPISYLDPVVQERTGRKKCFTNALMSIMGVDKKNDGRKKRIVLLSGIGRTHELKASVVTDRDIRIVLSSAVQVHPFITKHGEAVCTPPGSKSISNRALLLAALGQGQCRITNLLHSDDTDVMLRALTELQCASFEWESDGEVLLVNGSYAHMQASSKELFLGNAGTASRFLTSVATLAGPGKVSSSILSGNKRMKARPIGPLVDALRGNGASIQYLENEGSLPLRVEASRGIEGGDINLAATVSSQYVSSILMCAPYAKKPVTLRLHGGKPISQPYIDMTTAMMASFGIQVTKSKAEPHTYHIPQGSYINPPEYHVESDASSATYPLAVAAITGTTCTVSNIGSNSLQGDSRFAIEILRPMGCTVLQSHNSTTVTGPEKGGLRPLQEVDMEPMTDAFLTTSVLASVAQNSDGNHKTRIVGIANQRVKECNRIRAMKDQLGKFGVTCYELDDGIEVHGTKFTNLKSPHDGVECYDDHRVAMSFSVLALLVPTPTLIRDRECVGKTWPGWWDVLARTFGSRLEGIDLAAKPDHETKCFGDNCQSIYVIGMRGAGKTTAGAWASKVLGWPFVDLDSQLELELDCSIPDLIKAQGWDRFRKHEVALLKKFMTTEPSKHIFACGGGIVESEEARKMLIQYNISGGPVLLVHREIEDVIDFLRRDRTRPAYMEDMGAVWLRREPWYKECSNYEYFSGMLQPRSLESPAKDFSRLLNNITARNHYLEQMKAKESSFFVSLTVPNIDKALGFLDAVVVGSDAVELRVDLLHDPDGRDGLPGQSFVYKQLNLLQSATNLPIIFTLRTAGQGGKFPNGKCDYAMDLIMLALRMGIEFLDVEVQHPEAFLRAINDVKGQTKIIASHHDPNHELSWSNGSWVPYYNKCLQYGDVVKLVGMAKEQKDNAELLEFVSWAKAAHETPIIAINMGIDGQLSRIQNSFMTPVSHTALPFKAAPGQLSAAEIRQALSLHGVIKPKQFFLFGKPITASRSPALHNELFRSTGLPHKYRLLETDSIETLQETVRADNFGGASVTIPLKLGIIQLLDDVSADAEIIGAVNTIVVDNSRQRCGVMWNYLVGQNTDWKGMILVLDHAGAQPSQGQSAIIIGGGGTARAAIYALNQMEYAPLYIVGRSPEKLRALIDTYPQTYRLQILASRAEVEALEHSPNVAISTIPADKPIDPSLHALLRQLFLLSSGDTQQRRLFLDMAYQPATTPLMEMAAQMGWDTIPGLEVLAGQGFYQVRLFVDKTERGFYADCVQVPSMDRDYTVVSGCKSELLCADFLTAWTDTE